MKVSSKLFLHDENVKVYAYYSLKWNDSQREPSHKVPLSSVR